MENGTTVVELLLVLGMLALVVVPLTFGLPAARDRVGVRMAAHSLAQAVRSARLAAQQTGGARLRVNIDSARVQLVRSNFPDQSLFLGSEFGVAMDARGARVPVLRFDGLGVGRFASRTFTLSRGRAVRRVVVSAYGRVDVR